MKQRESARSKAKSSTQERLIARETFQYVSTNPRKYGVASTRNERQLAKAMDSLHLQQNKRLAKLSSQIHEVKVHQWKLKEADETTRDPTTVEEQVLDTTAEEVSDETEPKNRGGLVARGRIREHSKTPNTRNEEGYDSRLTKVEDLFKTKIGPNRKSTQGKSTHVFIRTDPNVFRYHKYKSYNLMNIHKSTGKRVKSSPDSTKQPKSELPSINDNREKISMNKTHIGKINTKPDARLHSGQVPNISETDPINYGYRVPMPNGLPKHTTDKEAKGLSLHFHDGIAVNHEGETAVSDQETGGHEERPSMEENWAETLKSCRYLRKPRGYDTPEIPIESIFQND